MDNKNKNELDPKIQKMLNKLISEEWFAGNAYRQFVIAVKPEDRDSIKYLMLDIADDELNDHFQSLVDWALDNGYVSPSGYDNMKKYADKKDVQMFEKCQSRKDGLFYIDKGIESEERAIESYEEFVDADFLRMVPNLCMIVQNNYYDEQEHLRKLQFAKTSIEAMQRIQP